MEPINFTENYSASERKTPLMLALPDLVERRAFFQEQKHAQTIRPGDPDLRTVSDLLEHLNNQPQSTPKQVVDTPSKTEIRQLLQNPDQLTKLDNKYRNQIDQDKDSFLSNVELNNAVANSTLPSEVRLLAATLSEGYDAMIGLRKFNNDYKVSGKDSHLTYRGLHVNDVATLAQLNDYKPPHWLSPTSPGWVGTAGRYLYLGANVLLWSGLFQKAKVSPLASGLSAFSLGYLPFTILRDTATTNENLQNRHNRVKEMLKRLE